MKTKESGTNNHYNGVSPVRVLAFLEAKEGKRQELLDILIHIVEPSRKEEGNIAYVLNSSTERPNEIMIDELWSGKDAFDKHFERPESYRNRERVTGLLARPMEVKTYTEVTGKTT
jgi:quinol monooxygenase YgiN